MNPVDELIDYWEYSLWVEWDYSLLACWEGRNLRAECDEATCQQVLCELIALQMEHAWRQGSKSSPERHADHYLQIFYDFLNLDREVQLLAEEFRLRWRFGDKPGRQHFLQQHAVGKPGLVAALVRVENELKQEFGWKTVSQEITSPRTALAAQAPLSSSDFLVKKFIGAGSMGRVYVAWQHSLQRHVAIKFLRKHFVQNQAAVERFLHEGRLAASLRHPGIIVIHGLGMTPAGNVFIVMDLVDAPELKPINRTDKDEVSTLLDVVAQAAEAMAVAHAAGIIHCDLKPANILLSENDRTVLTDFGLARRLNEDINASPRGEGSPAWIAPEQVDACWGEIGPWTDVFNLMATLYWLLTGKSPHQGETADAVLASAVSGRPVVPLNEIAKEIPVALIKLCAAGLAKNPNQRLSSMAEFATRLRLIATSV